MKPTDTQCPVCQTVFQQPIRPQGGGRRSIYCSHRCPSLDWVRGNTGKRQAAILKYDNKPESKEKRRARTRKATLKKYRMTEDTFFSLLSRQRSRCAGCDGAIAQDTARIDHDHRTERVRGLICDQCNWALGFVRDNRARLYQLSAYLELDRSKPVVYLIGSLRNEKVIETGNALRSLDIEVIDNWVSAGKFADDAWQEYSVARGKTYQEALQSREANHVFFFDRAYLHLSDAAVLLHPAGKSAHLEFGYFVAREKPGYILMEEQPDRYDVMTQFSGSPIFHDRHSLIERLKHDLPAKESLDALVQHQKREARLAPWNADA